MQKRRWTPEEDAYLEENVGKVRIGTMAMHLNRTPRAVKKRLYRLGIGNTTTATGQITIRKLSLLLKVDWLTIKRWADKHGLKVIKRVTSNKQEVYLIDPVDFWKWAEQHKELVDFSRIEPDSIPPEPEWVQKERTRPRERKYTRKNWTTNETAKLKQLHKLGKTPKEIAKILGRSYGSTIGKYYRIREDKTCVRATR